MPKQPHVLIVGASYGGLSALNNLMSLSRGKHQKETPVMPPNVARGLRRRPRYTILDERDGFYHTVGAPLGQISVSFANEFWIKYEDIEKGKSVDEDVRFIQGTACCLDTSSKVLKYRLPGSESEKGELEYDYLIAATGLRRGWPVVPRFSQKSQHLNDVEQLERELNGCSRIVLVGGGAVGIEMAAEIKHHFPRADVILVHSRNALLSNEPLPDEFKKIAKDLLMQTGVIIILGQRVINEQDQDGIKRLTLSGGEQLECDRVIYTAQQQGANTGFILQDVVDEKGCIRARETLQFPESLPNADSHFAVGDAVSWSGIKRSGNAHIMGQFAATNIVQMLIAVEDGGNSEEAKLAACPPFKSMMSLAIGEQAIGMRFGLMYGKEVKERAFGRGLGIDSTLARLEIQAAAVVAKERELLLPPQNSELNGSQASPQQVIRDNLRE